MLSVNGIGGNDETFAEDAALFDNAGGYVMWAHAADGTRLGRMPSCPQWTMLRCGTSSAG